MENKICKICKLDKFINNFRKRKDSKSGYGNICKECESLKNKIYRENNKEIISEKRKNNRNLNYFNERYLNNKTEMLEYFKERYNKNKEHILEYQKKYYKENKNKIQKTKNKWYINNKENILERQNHNHKLRKKNDILYKLKILIKNNIKNSLNSKNIIKENRTHEILGCSIDEFKRHLESQWESWMNWDNYGNPKDGIFEPNKTWDIDHITPTSSAKTEEDLLKLNHYTNLQPLCSHYNRFIKRDNINH